MTDDIRQRFHELHSEGCFVMPNPWDAGSARILASLGFQALATTSSGHAASLGRLDGNVTLDELADHAAQLAAAVDVPLNVDAEFGFADRPDGLAATVDRLAASGAAGFSVEDYDPVAGRVVPLDEAVERVAAVVEANRGHGLVFTARAENHIRGVDDLDDTIQRLQAYRDAGADVAYAPGLVDLDAIRRVVTQVGLPVNVLARPDGPSVGELADAGVRRVSTGGALAYAAYAELVRGATELRDQGTSGYAGRIREGKAIRAALE
jgi:2-methylisocitrate lyase-like PEP mutase family enzyme